jgi:predicted DNA-binding protein with PD1-like motif
MADKRERGWVPCEAKMDIVKVGGTISTRSKLNHTHLHDNYSIIRHERSYIKSGGHHRLYFVLY